MILLKALTSQDLMSELEQGQNSASCQTELLEKSGITWLGWMLEGSDGEKCGWCCCSPWGLLPNVKHKQSSGQCLGGDSLEQHRETGGMGCLHPILEVQGLWGQRILCK